MNPRFKDWITDIPAGLLLGLFISLVFAICLTKLYETQKMSAKTLSTLEREDMTKLAQSLCVCDLNTDFRAGGAGKRAEVDPDDVTIVNIKKLSNGELTPVRVRSKYHDLAYKAIMVLREICE